ncbi:exopolyphosphatase/guanosine-5'-triphosphate,3'-diphosphate pyrophosphatase [Rhodovulum iodosum]|uniref:Exopolyphosphatase/guanosine-5'-triphosphate, 3'-diphosphate pyrophosphatase n=1 Tax=Rhodovulum iodosum TaxID=68291 RepID=A0ABV3XPK8_9RHOB|nr:Ppx/GppA family phosphatase [Rhodovulum robiginosum]RSK31445.1 Ppx/GppA family phosphatase [Rhodovulum robiginosum]
MDGISDQPSDDWGPFGRPLFNDPEARALSRVGVVDIGSNSVRLVVFDGAARSPAYFFNEKVMCGLGAGMSETGRLSPDGRRRALSALKRFALLAEGMDATPLTAVATAAMREAEDGPEFQEIIERETGLKLWVVDGTEEARLSAQGVLLGWPEAEGIVSDIGGSSMELAELKAGSVGKCATSPLGPLKLRDIAKDKKALAGYISDHIDRLATDMGTDHERLYLVGGSWRAIAKLDMARRDYPMKVLHEYRMTRKSLTATLKWIAENDPDELRSMTGTSSDRMSLVPLASEVLRQLVSTFKPSEIAISSYGIREGLLYEHMPQSLRETDPMIEACRFAEVSSARIPGFGRRLYSFVKPLFEGADPERRRLVKAACLLHDTAWRAHPDYRHEVCFDNATRANLGGLDHPGRVFLGLALLHRYKNNRSGSRFEPLFELLSEEEITAAEVLGKAMRFGSMFESQAPDRAAELRYSAKKNKLDLILAHGAAPLFGEVAESRFASLAKSLGVETEVKTADG